MRIGSQIKRAIGLFPNRRETERALIDLRQAGFPMDHVSAVAHDAAATATYDGVPIHKPRSASRDRYEKTKGGAQTGAIAGGFTGSMMGLVGGLGLLGLPFVAAAVEVGLFLTSILLGGGFGTVGGSLIGALIGRVAPDSHNQRELAQGDSLILVEGSAHQILQAEAILRRRKLLAWKTYSVFESNTLA